jgi:hypothetical protein
VTSVDDPEYITSATTSLYTTNTADDGSGDSVATNFALASTTEFSKSFQMVFQNTNSFAVYITTLELFARPAKIVKELYVREEDSTSVGKYDERVLTIENEFFNDETEAASKAQIILDDEAEYANTYIMTVKGNPALQVGDPVGVSVFGSADTFVIKKIVNRWDVGKFSQMLTVKKKTFRTFFTVGVSTIGGVDVIAP